MIKTVRMWIAFPKYLYTQFMFRKNFNYHSDMETLLRLQDGKTSISRFGDGEFDWILERGQENGFQKNDPFLGSELRRVIAESDGINHIVGIPRQMATIRNENSLNRNFWVRAIKARGLTWMSILSSEDVYWSSTFSRAYIGMRDREKSKKYLKRQKKYGKTEMFWWSKER